MPRDGMGHRWWWDRVRVLLRAVSVMSDAERVVVDGIAGPYRTSWVQGPSRAIRAHCVDREWAVSG